jgi:superfamily I DNA and/or RNA helicase
MRRLNVAITRARRCLVVVGDSATIGRHPVYARFVAYADALDSHRSSYEWIAA